MLAKAAAKPTEIDENRRYTLQVNARCWTVCVGREPCDCVVVWLSTQQSPQPFPSALRSDDQRVGQYDWFSDRNAQSARHVLTHHDHEPDVAKLSGPAQVPVDSTGGPSDTFSP